MAAKIAIDSAFSRRIRARNLGAWTDAAHKLGAFPNVRAVPLKLEDGFRFAPAEKFDAIFCMTVFEHLPEPLAIAGHLHSLLAPGGLLVFDYIQSDTPPASTRAPASINAPP